MGLSYSNAALEEQMIKTKNMFLEQKKLTKSLQGDVVRMTKSMRNLERLVEKMDRTITDYRCRIAYLKGTINDLEKDNLEMHDRLQAIDKLA